MADKQRASSIVDSFAVVLVGGLVAWAGSQGGVTLGRVPVFALIVSYAFVVQWVAFVPSYLGQTERYYDLTGSFTYISAIVLAVVTSLEPQDLDAFAFVGLAIWVLGFAFEAVADFQPIRPGSIRCRLRDHLASFRRQSRGPAPGAVRYSSLLRTGFWTIWASTVEGTLRRGHVEGVPWGSGITSRRAAGVRLCGCLRYP